MAKSKSVQMEALADVEYYDADSDVRCQRAEGDIFDVHDGHGMTAEEFANSLEAMKKAKRVESKSDKAKPKAAQTAVEPLKYQADPKVVAHRMQDVPTVKK